MAPSIYTLSNEQSSNPIMTTTLSKVASVKVEEVLLKPGEEVHGLKDKDYLDKSHQNTALLYEPSSITTDFDELRFSAAAYGQLRKTVQGRTETYLCDGGFQSKTSVHSTKLISSPYNSSGHYLDVSTLPAESRLFALALSILKPVRADYAIASYTEALNFDTVLELLRSLARSENFDWHETNFYVVIFRSQLKVGVDNDWLYKLDSESHREACESGGLLKYWFGKANNDRRNLATCKFRTMLCVFLIFEFAVLM